MTLSEILDAVLLRSGMGTETAYATSSKDEVLRMLHLANASAAFLAADHPWQQLRKTYQFSLTTANEYDMPADFQQLISDTAYVDATVYPIDMVTDAQYWGYIDSAVSSDGIRERMRIMGDKIHVHDPNSGETARFEYATNAPVREGSTEKAKFENDTDTWALNDEMLVLDILWRFQRLTGLMGWEDARAEAFAHRRLIKGQEAGVKTIYGGEYETVYGEPYTPLWVNNE